MIQNIIYGKAFVILKMKGHYYDLLLKSKEEKYEYGLYHIKEQYKWIFLNV